MLARHRPYIKRQHIPFGAPNTVVMASILDIPLFYLPFLTLVHLSTLSKECFHRSREALKLKNRGHELLTYFASVPLEKRTSLITNSITIHDAWAMWEALAIKTFDRKVNSIFLQKAAACEVDISTTHYNNQLNIEVSSQHIMTVETPYILLGGLKGVVHPSVRSATSMWVHTMNQMLDNNNAYSEVWWRTAPLTYFEINMVFMSCYRHNNVVISSIDGVAETSFDVDPCRVSANSMMVYLSLLADFYV